MHNDGASPLAIKSSTMGHGQIPPSFHYFFSKTGVEIHTPPKNAPNNAQNKNSSSIKHEKYSRTSSSVSGVIKMGFTTNTNYIRILKNSNFVSTFTGYTLLQCQKECCCISSALIKKINTFPSICFFTLIQDHRT